MQKSYKKPTLGFSPFASAAMVVLNLLVATVGFAQQSIDRYERNPRRHKDNSLMKPGGFKLRWQPLGLLNIFDANITVGAERFYQDRKSIYADLGYVFASSFSQNNGGFMVPSNGLTLRGGHRWYLGRYSPWFVEGDLTYKHVSYQSGETWVGRGVVNGVPAYQELLSFNDIKKVWTAEGKVGLLGRMGPNGNCAIESWIGVGIRHRNYYPNIPADAVLSGFNDFLFAYGKQYLISLPLGLRFTWKLNQSK